MIFWSGLLWIGPVWSGLVGFLQGPKAGGGGFRIRSQWHGHMPCPSRTGSSTVGRELFFRARQGGFSRTAVPDQCLQGLAGFGAVPGWPPRYGAGREFWPMFMRSGTAVRPKKTEDFSALLAASNCSYADKSGCCGSGDPRSRERGKSTESNGHA